jgi:hypothetical protein
MRPIAVSSNIVLNLIEFIIGLILVELLVQERVAIGRARN